MPLFDSVTRCRASSEMASEGMFILRGALLWLLSTSFVCSPVNPAMRLQSQRQANKAIPDRPRIERFNGSMFQSRLKYHAFTEKRAKSSVVVCLYSLDCNRYPLQLCLAYIIYSFNRYIRHAGAEKWFMPQSASEVPREFRVRKSSSKTALTVSARVKSSRSDNKR